MNITNKIQNLSYDLMALKQINKDLIQENIDLRIENARIRTKRMDRRNKNSFHKKNIKWGSQENKALLIKQNDDQCVLKLESEIQRAANYDSRRKTTAFK